MGSDASPLPEDQASALLAVQLSSESADHLREEFIRRGVSSEVADALAFSVVDDAADCAIRLFSESTMPQIHSYLELLVRNEEMSIVLQALNKMYEPSELDEMQSEVAKIVGSCLASSLDSRAAGN
jgi:hypothetical protein